MNEENKTEAIQEEVIIKDLAVAESDNKKKTKNLISLAILLGGLFAGSLFVDFSQLVRGGGISQKVLADKDIFQLNGKSWVAYNEPIVDIHIINDDECVECNVDEALVWFKKMLPTMLANKVDYQSENGKKLIDEYGIKSLPAFVFGKEIEETEFYTQAQPIFNEKNGKYVLDTAKLGVPVGKFIKAPSIGDNAIKIGPDNAKVKLVEFSDFQCPYCQVFQKTIDETIAQYGDDIQFIFKNLPIESIHPRAMAAANASECANEQGKFLEYSDKLFTNQKIWSATTDNKMFINYATQLKLDTVKFTQCVTDEKYANKIQSDLKEATDFGITGTPAIFINDTFKSGAVNATDLKALIDAELSGEALSDQDGSIGEMDAIQEIEGEDMQK